MSSTFQVRRLIALTLALAGLSSPTSAATLATWDRGDQHVAARAGLLPVLSDHRFHGERPLTGNRLVLSPSYIVNWGATLQVVPAVNVLFDVKHVSATFGNPNVWVLPRLLRLGFRFTW